MAEEKKTATEEVADEDLSKAWDAVEGKEETVTKEPEVKEVSEEEKSQEASAETPPEEKTDTTAEASAENEALDHKESSKLGRKFKGLEGRFERIEKLLIEREKEKSQSTEQPIEVPEVIATPDDIEKYLQAKEQRSRKEQMEYENGYLRQIQELAKDNEDLHDEIYDEMIKNFNRKYSNFASADARVNYAEAKAAVISRKLSEGEKGLPKRDTAKAPPVQPAASATRITTRPATLPTLDKEAADYVAYLRKQGMSEEDIAKELS